jgi:hypothetical protein
VEPEAVERMSKAVRTILSILVMAVVIPLVIIFIVAPIILRYFGVLN